MKLKNGLLLLASIFVWTIAFASQENTNNIHQELLKTYQQWANQKLTEAKQLITNQAVSQIDKNQAARNTNTHRTIIFLSFSMPEQSLRQWLQQAKKAKATVVIRGLVNNSFRDTINQMKPLIGENKIGLQINPALFKQYHIQQVPAVVLDDGSNFDVVYGNVPLDDALNAISQHATQ